MSSQPSPPLPNRPLPISAVVPSAERAIPHPNEPPGALASVRVATSGALDDQSLSEET